MLGVDSCIFFNLYDKSRPENQTKRGEINSVRTMSKVLIYVFCSKRIDFRAILRNTLETPSFPPLVMTSPPLKNYVLSVRSVRDGQTHPHRPRLVVSHSTCPPLSSSPHAHSFVIGPAVIKHSTASNTTRVSGFLTPSSVLFSTQESRVGPVPRMEQQDSGLTSAQRVCCLLVPNLVTSTPHQV
jgi:hypothetical protein